MLAPQTRCLPPVHRVRKYQARHASLAQALRIVTTLLTQQLVRRRASVGAAMDVRHARPAPLAQEERPQRAARLAHTPIWAMRLAKTPCLWSSRRPSS